MRPDKLPPLDARIVHRVPASLAREYRLIPVAQTGDSLVVVCSRPLADEEIETLKYMSHHEQFEFVVDPQAYQEVRRNLDLLLRLYFPSERPGFISSPDLPGGVRGR